MDEQTDSYDCPGCEAQLSADAVVCIACGYDLRSKQRLHTELTTGLDGRSEIAGRIARLRYRVVRATLAGIFAVGALSIAMPWLVVDFGGVVTWETGLQHANAWFASLLYLAAVICFAAGSWPQSPHMAAVAAGLLVALAASVPGVLFARGYPSDATLSVGFGPYVAAGAGLLALVAYALLTLTFKVVVWRASYRDASN